MLVSQVGSIVNFSLMYFLAPTAGSSGAATGFISTLFSDRILRSWGAPGVVSPQTLLTAFHPLAPLLSFTADALNSLHPPPSLQFAWQDRSKQHQTAADCLVQHFSAE